MKSGSIITEWVSIGLLVAVAGIGCGFGAQGDSPSGSATSGTAGSGGGAVAGSGGAAGSHVPMGTGGVMGAGGVMGTGGIPADAADTREAAVSPDGERRVRQTRERMSCRMRA